MDCGDIIGLKLPEAGGESSLVSSVTVHHNEMLKSRPDLEKVLYKPIYRDGRDEIPVGIKPWYLLAVFHVYEGYFSASIEPTYISSAHRFKDFPEMSRVQQEAITMAQSLSERL